MNSTGNTILITGGGSGIGAALAQRLHDLGNTIIIAGRKLEPLQQVAMGRERITALSLDVDSAAAIQTFAHKVVSQFPALNVLINNAGIMRAESLLGARDLTDAESIITTNLLGPIRMIDALTGHLARQDDAAIINTTSGLAFVPLAHYPTYSATKAALHSYTVSLRQALKGKVEVIELAPPAVRTRLTPGQESVEAFLPLDDFADEAVTLLCARPTPSEVLVQRVHFQRNAEKEGRFEQTLAALHAQR